MDGPPPTERHLQAVWFDARFRPPHLVTARGETVRVCEPGRWNLERGPDFIDAALLVGKATQPLLGDVEVHFHPRDWHYHGHHRDPAYGNVIAHVTYFRSFRDVTPAPVIRIALAPMLATDSRFSFDAIDTTAYPHADLHQEPKPCAALLDRLGPDYAGQVLETAGVHRLKLKAGRMRKRARQTGFAQALYECVMAALGYKHNQQQCRHLAHLLPLEQLRYVAGPDRFRACALLLGVAGLLPDPPMSQRGEQPNRLPRRLWDTWWRSGEAWTPTTRPDWDLAYVRPANHPVRRLAAAADLWTRVPALEDQLRNLATDHAADWISRARALFQTPKMPGLFGETIPQAPYRLIGPSRAAAMLTNVVVPWLMAQDKPIMHLARNLPAESGNGVTRQAAHHLLGPDCNPAIYRTGLRQQGLIQTFHDFCLDRHNPCENCRLVQTLAKAAKHQGVNT